MLIKIKRVYLNSGLESEILINTRYIVEIAPNHNPDKPRTLIVKDSFSRMGPDIIYTNESVPTIKAKITKQAKVEDD